MAEIKTLVKQLRAAQSPELRDHLVEEIARAAGESIIAAAVTARKIADADVPRYRSLWATDPAAVRQLLTAPMNKGGLAPGVVARGQSASSPEAYPAEWLAVRAEGRSRVTGEQSATTRAHDAGTPRVQQVHD
jgi:hypothetical protein